MPLVYFLSSIALSFICTFFAAEFPCAAIPSTNQPLQDGGIPTDQLTAIEQKLLQKTYNNDPLAKRLQRLELTLFGTTQYGSNEQRWRNIKHSLSNANAATKNVSSSLGELEKYIFKKTMTAQAPALRLNRLETKLFGKPSPSMPIAYRIQRLQRTLGITGTSGGMAQLPGTLPPSVRGVPGIEGAPPTFGFENNFGFGDNGMGDPEFNQMESQMSQMFREMQEMQQMQPHGFDQTPGYEEHHFYMYSTPDGGFKFGTEADPHFGNEPKQSPKNKKPPGQKSPTPTPHLVPPPTIPGDKIPSYADPNFI